MYVVGTAADDTPRAYVTITDIFHNLPYLPSSFANTPGLRDISGGDPNSAYNQGHNA
jgi:hypothetical protein